MKRLKLFHGLSNLRAKEAKTNSSYHHSVAVSRKKSFKIIYPILIQERRYLLMEHKSLRARTGRPLMRMSCTSLQSKSSINSISNSKYKQINVKTTTCLSSQAGTCRVWTEKMSQSWWWLMHSMLSRLRRAVIQLIESTKGRVSCKVRALKIITITIICFSLKIVMLGANIKCKAKSKGVFSLCLDMWTTTTKWSFSLTITINLLKG